MTAMRVMRLPQASTVELDSLIRSPFGAGEQRQRLGKAERLGRLEVDDQLILGRRLHGQIGQVRLLNAFALDWQLIRP